jgi:pimeloyl-ACP methyl ester carboxylesterase
VLLHPLGADRDVWTPIVDRLYDRRELITIDMPGFGASPPLRDVTPTPATLAAAIAALLAELGLHRPHAAGNSLGGWVALELGRRGAVASTTAIAPAGLWAKPLSPKPSLAHGLAKALRPLIGPLAASTLGRRLLLNSAVAHPDRVPPAQSAHLVSAYGGASGFVAVNRAMRAGRFTDLAAITCPVTLVWPEHDRLVTRPGSLPSNVRSIALPDAGHIPFWDAPDAVAEILLAASSG